MYFARLLGTGGLPKLLSDLVWYLVWTSFWPRSELVMKTYLGAQFYFLSRIVGLPKHAWIMCSNAGHRHRVNENHIKKPSNGEWKSLVDTGGWSILRIASPRYVLQFPERFQPYKNDLILIAFLDFKEYHHTPTYQAVTWWVTWETHTQKRIPWMGIPCWTDQKQYYIYEPRSKPCTHGERHHAAMT